MLRRYLPFWIGIAIFGLAIGLPLGWGFSQFHSLHTQQSPERVQSGNTPETFWERFRTDPTAFGAIVLCGVTAILAAYTALLWGATGRLVKGADETAKRQLRAYPGITGATIDIIDDKIQIAVVIENFSATPAYKFRHAIAHQFCPPGNIDDCIKMAHKDMQWDMAPRSKTTMRSSGDISEEQAAALISGNDLVLMLCGRVDYEDAFGKSRYIKFRYRNGRFARAFAKIQMSAGEYLHQYQRCSEPEPISYDSN